MGEKFKVVINPMALENKSNIAHVLRSIAQMVGEKGAEYFCINDNGFCASNLEEVAFLLDHLETKEIIELLR